MCSVFGLSIAIVCSVFLHQRCNSENVSPKIERSKVQCKSMFCVRAGHKARWIAVEVVERSNGDRSCPLCSTKRTWALQLLRNDRDNREAHDCQLVIRTFEKNIRQQLESADGFQPGSAQRKAMGKKGKWNGFQTIQVKGVPLDIALHKGPGLQLRCCGENIVNVFSVLESTFKDLLAQGREAQYVRNTMKADGARQFLETVPTWALRRDRSAAANFDTGKIRFDIGKEAYVITYIDADGAQHTLSRGLITCASSRCWRQSVQFGGSQQNQGTCPEEGPHNVEHT